MNGRLIGGAASQDDSAREMGPMHSQLQRAGKAATELHNVVTELESVLRPITKPSEKPAAEDARGAGVRSVASCDFVEQQVQTNMAIDTQIERLSSLIQRLQL